MEPTSPWKKPNEVMRLHRMKKRKKTLQERITQSPSSSPKAPNLETSGLDFSRILEGDKRKNPFSKNNLQQSKKTKLEEDSLDESSDKTLFALLSLPAKVVEKPPQELDTEKLSTFSNLLQKFTADHTVEAAIEKKYKHLPIDWALKTKIRLMSPKPFAWTSKLKASEEASGITGFVRCVDTQSSQTLDTSPRARLHQACLYWQQPQLPWLQQFPRGGRQAAGPALAACDTVRAALHTHWTESFRSLFQLVRARHCPYFYVCANTFTSVFIAAGVCGLAEPTAMLAPTTRGLRQALQQEDVEFTMPLRQDKKKLNTSNEEQAKSTFSVDSSYSTMDEVKEEGSGDEDPDLFLSQLGLETEFVKKINHAQSRAVAGAESSVDRAAESLVLVRGADAQALFNFLLNCRSVTSRVGPLAGVPPTLLAPTAFQGATLCALKVRENIIYSESKKFYSLELRGPILPSCVHALLDVVRRGGGAGGVAGGGGGAEFSATFAHLASTLAFSAAASATVEEEASKENEPNHFTKAFNKENLSDCGVSEEMLQLFCSSDPSIIRSLDSVKYNPDDDTYTW